MQMVTRDTFDENLAQFTALFNQIKTLESHQKVVDEDLKSAKK